jgi:hypothetical protein
MLKREREDRWFVYLLIESIQESSVDPSAQYLYIGRCCLDTEETSESVTSDTSEEAQVVTIKAPDTRRERPSLQVPFDPKYPVPPSVETTTNERHAISVLEATPPTTTGKHPTASSESPESLGATMIRFPNKQAAESDSIETRATARIDSEEELLGEDVKRGDDEWHLGRVPPKQERTTPRYYHYPTNSSSHPVQAELFSEDDKSGGDKSHPARVPPKQERATPRYYHYPTSSSYPIRVPSFQYQWPEAKEPTRPPNYHYDNQDYPRGFIFSSADDIFS